MHDFSLPADLAAWADRSLAEGRHVLATSNQGTVLLYRQDGMEFVLKTFMGRGAVRRARRATLMREHEAYRRMEGLAGVPRCHGLVDGRFLAMEYVRGCEYREAVIPDREAWFAELLAILQGFHERGVAHGDLKSKDNLMQREDGSPCVIDFGTTVLRHDGFRPINHRLFNYARQLDLNAWVKHKYQGRYEDASPADAAMLDYGWIERRLRARRRRQAEKEANHG